MKRFIEIGSNVGKKCCDKGAIYLGTVKESAIPIEPFMVDEWLYNLKQENLDIIKIDVSLEIR